MSVGFSPKLPLQPDSVDGFYKLNKTLGEVAKQNLKMIVLTTPGERIMQPDFGVGARNFLFDTAEETYQSLTAEILKQVRKFLPFIEIIDINLADEDPASMTGNSYASTHTLRLQVIYFIPNLNLNDTLEVVVSSNA